VIEGLKVYSTVDISSYFSTSFALFSIRLWESSTSQSMTEVDCVFFANFHETLLI